MQAEIIKQKKKKELSFTEPLLILLLKQDLKTPVIFTGFFKYKG